MFLIGFLIVNTLSLLITAYVVPGFEVDSFVAAIIAAIMLGVINTFVKPVVSLIALPITVLTLGLFSFVLNILFLYLAAAITPGFEITGIVAAIIGSVVLSLVSTFLGMLTK